MSNSVLQLSDTLTRAQADPGEHSPKRKSQQTSTNTHTKKTSKQTTEKPYLSSKSTKICNRELVIRWTGLSWPAQKKAVPLYQTASSNHSRPPLPQEDLQRKVTCAHPDPLIPKAKVVFFPSTPQYTCSVLCTYWLPHESTQLSQKSKKSEGGGDIFCWVSKLNNW